MSMSLIGRNWRLPDRLPIPYTVCSTNNDDSCAVNRNLNARNVSGTWNIEMVSHRYANVCVRLNGACA